MFISDKHIWLFYDNQLLVSDALWRKNRITYKFKVKLFGIFFSEG
jgi:hypothetical protein